jgi:2'-5' RNA ligase
MRLFVAIEFDEPVRRRLVDVQDRLRRAADGVRWIPGEQLHVTVKFLGEVRDDRLAEVSGALEAAAADVSPFSIRIAECGCFPPRGGVRIVWVGAAQAPEPLLACVQSVEGQMQRIGFPKEHKRFSPHVTIGRVREDRSAGAIRSAVSAQRIEPIEQPVNSMTLMSSVLSPKGPTYSPVSRAALR